VEEFRDSEFPMLLKNVLEADMAAHRVKPPPHRFEEMMDRLEGKRGKRRLESLARKGLVAALLLVFLSSALYLVFPQQVTTAGRRLLTSIQYIFVGEDGASPDHPYLRDLHPSLQERLEKAGKGSPYAIKLPAYLPGGSRVTDIRVDEKTGNFILSLLIEGPQARFHILQMEMANGTIAMPRDAYEKVEEVLVGGYYPGAMGIGETYSALSFSGEQGVQFFISGQIGEEDLLRVAESLTRYGR
jgi:hypothetical protein